MPHQTIYHSKSTMYKRLCLAAVVIGVFGLLVTTTLRASRHAGKSNPVVTAQSAKSSPPFRTKPIQQIRAGDKVWAIDPVTGRWEPKTVLRPMVHDYSGDLVTIKVGTETLESTGDHPFWVAGGNALQNRAEATHVPVRERFASPQGRWVAARDVQAGDKVVLLNGGVGVVELVLIREGRQPVYNLEVADLHTYAAGSSGVAVHNCETRTNCFPAGTLVLMANGTVRPIQDIRVGDHVLGCDPNAGQPKDSFKVEGIWRDTTAFLVTIAIHSSSGSDVTVEATRLHPFWTFNRGWVAAKDLQSGDQLADSSGKTITVNSTRIRSSSVQTYNLTVARVHTFYVVAGVESILVHNALIYRAMLPSPSDGLPQVGTGSNMLGARPGVDIFPDSAGLISPGSGGISVNTTPYGMPKGIKPISFGGENPNTRMFSIESTTLPEGLRYIPGKGTTHGTIEPSEVMMDSVYQGLLGKTRPNWIEQAPPPRS